MSEVAHYPNTARRAPGTGRIIISGGREFTGQSLQRYQQAVTTVLTSLHRHSSCGRALIDFLLPLLSPKILIIQPFPQSELPHNQVHADTGMITDADVRRAMSGVGALLVTIRFTPKLYEARADVQTTLFHELVHATRALTGRLRAGAPSPNHYHNISEYYAVILSNIFASEQHPNVFGYGYTYGGGTIDIPSIASGDPFWQSTMNQIVSGGQARRADQMVMRNPVARSFASLSPGQQMDLSRRFARDPTHRPKMEALRRDNPGLFNTLANVGDAPFNPLRDLP